MCPTARSPRHRTLQGGAALDRELGSQVERWFVRRGIPHFIESYSATEDVFTRAAPFLAAVLFAEAFLVFGDRFAGLGQAAAFVGGVAIIVAAAVIVNRLRGRPALALPEEVGAIELGVFVLAPTLVRQIADPGARSLIESLVLQGLILAVVFIVTSYGLLPMARWSLVHFAARLGTLASLLVKVLPLMLVFSLFLFINAEVWQVAGDMPTAYFTIVMCGIGFIGFAFLVWSVRGEFDDIATLASWDRTAALAADTPMASVCPRGPERPQVAPLSRAERANLQLVLVFSRLVPAALVTLGVFALYVGFGLLAIRERVILSWIGEERLPESMVIWQGGFLGSELVMTRPLLYVASLIAAISGLQFAVSLATDPSVRTDFADDVVHEVREAVAARAAYLELELASESRGR